MIFQLCYFVSAETRAIVLFNLIKKKKEIDLNSYMYVTYSLVINKSYIKKKKKKGDDQIEI
jgi:hypothetical protein